METAIVLMKTDPARAADIGEQLAHLPGVNHVYVTEGTHQLAALIAGRTRDDLKALIEHHLARTDGLEITETLTTQREFSRLDMEQERVGLGP